MYEFLVVVVWWWWWLVVVVVVVVVGGGGRAQRFFRLLRAEAARLVLKLRAGARLPGHRRSALGGRTNP
jgi:hypothetical protein